MSRNDANFDDRYEVVANRLSGFGSLDCVITDSVAGDALDWVVLFLFDRCCCCRS